MGKDNLAKLLLGNSGTTTTSQGDGVDKRKQSLYFPDTMVNELKEEAKRLDRSLSWVVQRAWILARNEIRQIPSVTRGGDDLSFGDDE